MPYHERYMIERRRFLQRLFPSRQIMIRSGGRLVNVRLSSTTQLTGAVVVALIVGWVSFTSLIYVNYENILAAKQGDVARARTAYKSLLAQVSVYRDKILAVTENLEENHSKAVSLLEQNTILDERLKATEDKLTSTQAEKRKVGADKQKLVDGLQKIRSELQDATKVGEGVSDLAVVELKRKQTVRERLSLRAELGRLEQGMVDISTADTFSSDMDSIEIELRKVILQRDLAKAEGDGLRDQIKSLQEKISDVEKKQINIVQRFTSVARERSDDIEKALSGTGLNLKDFLKKNKSSALGGPLVPFDSSRNDGSPMTPMLASMATSFARWNALQMVVEEIPLGQPLRAYRVSSPFGPRRDPFTGKVAFHQGVDLAAPLKSPVFATSPGKVVYAGWRGSYGRLVEIDHGNGIKTRFGHLNKILVRKGERVDRSTKIALLGTSGRSTGPHVHYEVRVNGKPRDPYQFIKAGIHVFRK